MRELVDNTNKGKEQRVGGDERRLEHLQRPVCTTD